tara:strand:+ start:1713 stop:2468 length:756 start_codon:yes stop_codon:yes gene_type:complete
MAIQHFGEEVPKEKFGGKAHNLAVLTKTVGDVAQVPQGFAISPDHVLNKDKKVLEILENVNLVCGGFPVAVRSSAIGEDGVEHSFAGQYDTILNVQTLKELLVAIRTVRDSAHSDRVEAYTRNSGLAKTGVGVVVQRMINSTMSGVLFTAEPVENDTSVIFIEAVEGLGDKMVSGHASPDSYEIVKNSGLVKEQHCIEGRPMCREELSKMLEIGMHIENIFGCPQDIEWAITRGIDGINYYVLQARPITTI